MPKHYQSRNNANPSVAIVEYGSNFIPVLPIPHLEHQKRHRSHRDLEVLAWIIRDHYEELCTTEEYGRILTSKQI